MAIGLLAVGSARAASFTFSEASSATTPTEWLAATVDYTLVDAYTLELRVTNQTTEPAPFDITLVFFNTAPQLQYVSLISAASSLEGPNTDVWHLGYYGYDRLTPRFGTFDYSLRTQPGAPAGDRIAPGETQSFTLLASCAGYTGCFGDVLDGWSEGGANQARAALRFAYGPAGTAGFGAAMTAVPEPHSAALLSLGLAALSAARARRPVARGPRVRRSPRAA